MTLRTTSKAVTFRRPFALKGVDGEQPAGTYEIEIDEALIEGVTFPVYRRVEARISLPWRTIGASGTQTLAIDLAELEAAAAADAAMPAEPERPRR